MQTEKEIREKAKKFVPNDFKKKLNSYIFPEMVIGDEDVVQYFNKQHGTNYGTVYQIEVNEQDIAVYFDNQSRQGLVLDVREFEGVVFQA